MDSKSEHKIADNGAQIEVGTVTHEGRDFANLGSVVDHANGFVFGFVGRETPPGHHDTVRTLTTWDGKKVLGAIWPTSSWPVRSHIGSRMYAFRARVDGIMYQGRGLGEGMSVKLRKMRGTVK